MNSKSVEFTSSIDKINIMSQTLDNGDKLITFINKGLDNEAVVTQIKPEDVEYFKAWVASL